jgi:transposase
MRYIGLDVHKRLIEAAFIDEQGKLLHRAQVECTHQALERFARTQLEPTDRIALEATTNSWAVLDALESFVQHVVVSNPLRTRAIAEAKIKTDKVDALVLAQLLRADYLPHVWQPDLHTRRVRSLVGRRASLVQQRTAIKNRLHAVLHQRLIHAPVAELFGTRGRAWLAELELDSLGRAAVDSELRLLDGVNAEIDALTLTLSQLGYHDARVKLLMTLPGVDVAVAQTILAALGDISRFRSPDHAASYLGLVPSTRQSANHCYHGPITKHGNGHARWMLVQSAQHVASHPGPLGVFFRRLCSKKNRNVAVVATARKLVTIAWHMLTRNEPYRYALPRPTEQKLSRLRVRATAERRRGGIPKGSPRPPSYGSGAPSRAVPSIDQVYASEALPLPVALSSGERRMLRRSKLVGFERELHRPRRIPKNSAASKIPTSGS